MHLRLLQCSVEPVLGTPLLDMHAVWRTARPARKLLLLLP